MDENLEKEQLENQQEIQADEVLEIQQDEQDGFQDELHAELQQELQTVVEDTLKDEGELPELVFEEHRTEPAPDDSQQYIKILLEELEQAKKALEQSPGELQAKDKAEKKATKANNLWRSAAIFFGVMFVACLVVLYMWYGFYKNMSKDDEVVGALSDNVENVQIAETTYKLKEDAAEYIKSLSDGAFEAVVEDINGYEYISFYNSGIKVCYRNEFEKEADTGYNVIIDNGLKSISFRRDYSFEDDINRLVPLAGTFGTENNYFALAGYAEDGRILELLFVETDTLTDLGSFVISEKLLTCFDISYEELPDADVAGATLDYMTLNIGKASYKYKIKESDYIDAVYYEEALVKFEDYLQVDISEEGMTFSTEAYLSEDRFLGKFSGNIIIAADGVRFSGVAYRSYAEPEIEDYGSDKVIVPRSNMLTEYVSIYGKANETYILEMFENADRSQFNMTDNWLKGEDGIYTYYSDGVPASSLGIDVSKYQGKIDWKSVKAAGVEFAFIRLGFRGKGEGTLELDTYYERNIKGALEAGVNTGVYFFSQALNEEEAVAEAEFVIEKLKGHAINYPVAIDLEEMSGEARGNNLTREQRTKVAIAFCERIKEAGYVPIIYANTKYMLTGFDLEQLNDYDKWFAFYSENVTFPYEYTILQYSNKGKIPGINGDVDLNAGFFDYSVKE